MAESNADDAYSSGGAARFTREALMAKTFATGMAQRVIDLAPRIHEGATEARKLIVAWELLETCELTRRQAIE